jgi:hypothetical protein
MSDSILERPDKLRGVVIDDKKNENYCMCNTVVKLMGQKKS